MPRRDGFLVGLYAPCTESAFRALQGGLNGAGLQTAVRLPGTALASKLKYGVLPYGWLRLSLRNGKEPTGDAVEVAVEATYSALRKRFGEVALDLNGRLIGEIPPRI